MNWTIKLFIAMMLTSATGMIIFIIWYWIGRFLEKMGYINIMYLLLRLVLIFWFVPMAYLTIFIENNKDGNFLFFNTDMFIYGSRVFILIWAVVVCYSCVRYFTNMIIAHRHVKKAFECELKVKTVFDDICTSLKIKKGRVHVMQSFELTVPICVGTVHPIVIIPDYDYTLDELQVIFVHELTHYKHKDQWFKHLTFFALCLHCFNPAIYMLKRKVSLWAEYACDTESVRVLGSKKRYFEVICKVAQTRTKLVGVYSSLVEDESEILDRMKHIKRSEDMTIKSKWKAALCVATMFVAGTTSVYAATEATQNIYLNAYNATVNEVRELSKTVTDDGCVEYEVTGLESGVIEEEGTVEAITRAASSYTFGWRIKKNYALRSAGFKASSGQVITVTAIGTPSNVTYHLGIVEPSGTRRYVSGKDIMAHDFKLDETGTYYVYVQNMSKTSALDVSGAYRVQ